MKLSKFLKTLPKNQIIKVGTKEGNGWWYVGTAKDLADNIDIYDSMMMETAEKYLKCGKSAFNSKISKGTPEYYIRAVANGENWKNLMDIAHYNDWLSNWFKSMARKKSKLDKLEEYYKSYQHLHAREVVDSSKADDAIEEDCIRIVIAGIERGVYWATSDAKELPSVGFDACSDEKLSEEEADEIDGAA